MLEYTGIGAIYLLPYSSPINPWEMLLLFILTTDPYTMKPLKLDASEKISIFTNCI